MELLILGAINIETNKYTTPSDALKTEKYKCPDSECGQTVILRQGNVNRAHFAHLPNSECLYYSPHPSESQVHIDAKVKMRTLLLDKNSNLEILTRCICCKETCEYDLSDIQDVKLEWRFKINLESGLLDECGVLRIADIACFDSNGLSLIIEIKNTHAQSDRPEPWTELFAQSVILNTTASFECCRHSFLCDECKTRPYSKKPYCLTCGCDTKGLVDKCDICKSRMARCISKENERKKCKTCEKIIKSTYKLCYDCYTNPVIPSCEYCGCSLGDSWKTCCRKCWFRFERRAKKKN